jgi:hypothetical protein
MRRCRLVAIDHVDVVDAVVGQHLQHDLEQSLADVGARIDRQRQRDVIDRNRDLHPRLEQRVQRLHLLGVVQGVADRARGLAGR